MRDEHRIRNFRQMKAARWCEAAFGHNHAIGLPQRGIRTAEEAIELAQALGVDKAMLHHLIEVVYSRPVGEVGQELGGLGVCILTVAAAVGCSADYEEERELVRVLAKPLEHFRRRNEEKNALGLDAGAKAEGLK